MGIIISIWRRFFGGFDSKYDILEKRGIQCAFLLFSVFCWEFFAKGFTWWASLLIAFFVYMFFCKSHFYYFLCSTESDAYIDEQENKGRKPSMDWIVRPVNECLGFVPRSRQYCFIGLLLRYTLWSIPITFFVGSHFLLVGLSIAFIYNACFWINLPPCKLASSPTNWAELFTGAMVGYGLL
ncbi:MAG: hypothetical protein NC124_02270 [Clostridium sp.]|nr:hypothetical protein [Clostridium sp.]